MRRLRAIVCAVVVLTIAGLTSTSQATLVGYWNFNSDNSAAGAGGIADLAGGDHNATLVGGSFSSDVPTALAGGTARSLDLTGGDRYAIVDSFVGGATENDLDGGTAITVSAWIKGWPDGDWEPFVSKRGEGDGWQLRRRSNSDRQSFTLRGTGGDDDPTGTIDLDANTNWHHVLGVYDGASRKFYVDGVLDLELPDGGTVADTNAFVVFGARDNSNSSGPHTPSIGNYSRIQIDDVAIYNEALSENQIIALSQGAAADALPTAPPKLNWDFTYTLQGWSVEAGGPPVHSTGTGGGVRVSASTDAAHANFLIRSPEFHFDGSTFDGTNALMVELGAGAGDQNGNIANYVDPAYVLAYNGGNSNSTGVKALGILDLETGQYVKFFLKSANGGTQVFNLTPADLTGMGLEIGKTYRMDFFDTDDGGWGWTQLNQIMIAGALGDLPVAPIPEPASLALLGLGAMALVRRRRRIA